MRRTRHIALPVRAWQYVGLLVVSLACLTLGLVSRDKEGQAGSLAGPELKHRAPHEFDACPNLTFFTKLPHRLDLENHFPIKISGTTREHRIFGTSSILKKDLGTSRQRIDHASKDISQHRTDSRRIERTIRQKRDNEKGFSRRTRVTTYDNRKKDYLRHSSERQSRPFHSQYSRYTDYFDERRVFRRSTDLKRDRESNRRTIESRKTENIARSVDRREIGDDKRNQVSRLNQDRRSVPRTLRRAINTFERRERINGLILKERVRDLFNDRKSERTVHADSRRDLRSRSREEFRFNRRRIETRVRSMERDIDERLKEQRFLNDRLAREGTDRRSMEQRLDRRSEKQTRTERSLMNRRLTTRNINFRNVEGTRDRRLMTQGINDHRLTERKMNLEGRIERRSLEGRLMAQNTYIRRMESREAHRSLEQKANRRLMERRMNRELVKETIGRRIVVERIKNADLRRLEQKTDRRLMEATNNRRLMEQRINNRRSTMPRNNLQHPEGRIDPRMIERRVNRRLATWNNDLRTMERRIDHHLEQKTDRRSMQRSADRQRLEKRLVDQRISRHLIANEIPSGSKDRRQRDTDHTLRITFHQRYLQAIKRSKAQILIPDSMKRSTYKRDDSRSLINVPKKDSSTETLENIVNRSNDFIHRVKAADFYGKENSLIQIASYEVLRQSFLIGLCTIYGFSLFSGKRSIFSNLVTRATRFTLW